MKNFFGRLLILIAIIASGVLFFISLGTILFLIFSDQNILANCLSTDLSSSVLLFSFYSVSELLFGCLAIKCLFDIIKARRMRLSLIFSLLTLAFLVSSLVILIATTSLHLPPRGFCVAVEIAKIATCSCLLIGSAVNFKKDCK